VSATNHSGVRVRHSRSCPKARGGRRCECAPTYEASVGTGARGAKVRRSFPTEAAAVAWRLDVQRAVKAGTYRSPSRQTIREAALYMVAGMRFAADGLREKATPGGDVLAAWGVSGEMWEAACRDAKPVRRRGGEPYKPSVIRSYEASLLLYVLPALGGKRVAEVSRGDVRRFVADLEARHTLRPRGASGATKPLDASTIRNAVGPLRLLYRLAVAAEVVDTSPVAGVELPVPKGRRERVAEADEAALLVATLTRPADRLAWALAFYAGLRVGEIRALRWRHVDTAAGKVRVREALDARGQTIPPKSKAGKRDVPIIEPLRRILARVERGADDAYVAGRTPTTPLAYTALLRRARVAWERAGLARVTPHEARHTFASWMVAADVRPFDLQRWLGHADLSTTMGLYVHATRDADVEQAARADAYFARGDTAGRLVQVGGE
jgi:integrase